MKTFLLLRQPKSRKSNFIGDTAAHKTELSDSTVVRLSTLGITNICVNVKCLISQH